MRAIVNGELVSRYGASSYISDEVFDRISKYNARNNYGAYDI
jgi:hypothetical protein